MNIWEFASAHPVTAIILAVLAVIAWQTVFHTAFRAFNRAHRTKNIQSQGWPPRHLDADGDYYEPKKDEEEK